MHSTKKIIYFSLFLAFLPLCFAHYLGFHSDFFAIIDSLVLSLVLSAMFLLLIVTIKQKSALFVTLITALTIILLKVSEEYYIYFDSFLTYRTLYLFDEFMLSFKNFLDGFLIFSFIAIAIATVLFMRNFLASSMNLQYKVIYSFLAVIFSCVFFLSEFHQERGTILNPFQQSNFGKLYLKDENPLMHFYRSFVNRNVDSREAEEYLLGKAIKTGKVDTIPDKYDFKKFSGLLPNYKNYRHSLSTLEPFKFVPNETSNEKSELKKNVIIIVMESIRDFETGNFDPATSLTPNLDKIAKLGLSFKNVFATSRYTVKSEQAILCGLIDYNKEISYSTLYGEFNGECLPKILNEHGFQSYFFHGNDKEFYNRGVYHKSLGFKNIIAKEDFNKDNISESDVIGWGVKDTVVFDKALQLLSEQQQPFFAEILTVTNHQPFDWDYQGFKFDANVEYEGEDRYKNYRKGISYSDFALGEFWKKFINSPLAKDTILVITGDHGVPYFPDTNLSAEEKFEILFRTPLVVYSEGLQGVDVNLLQEYSHLDIAPTILSMLAIKSEVAFIGRPIMGVDKTEAIRPIFNIDFDNYAFRYGGTTCLPIVNYCDSSSGVSCFHDERFSCKLSHPKHQDLIEQSNYMMNFISLSKNTGYFKTSNLKNNVN
ncbi:LTA synthase family protein [Thalassotalea sp. ND16A]|uniref:LTA synthase family protein n=1 Tax=Thalassotalea sp. ND16A TaxID=1535422 RepID=UPI00051A686F|nr:alkaline phosphatase family protein [Thalassotalea sp. ND16A]KGK01156.1 hypothetical protein ND16A_3018 [Thalassotalea sp. ND16A]